MKLRADLLGHIRCVLGTTWHAAFPMRQHAGWNSSLGERTSFFPTLWVSLPKVAGTFCRKESTKQLCSNPRASWISSPGSPWSLGLDEGSSCRGQPLPSLVGTFCIDAARVPDCGARPCWIGNQCVRLWVTPCLPLPITTHTV